MALPATITPITVTGRFVGPNGIAAMGAVRFTPSINASTSTGGGAQIPLAPLTVGLDANGAFSVVLAATDDPDWAAPGWTYAVTEQIVGAPERSYNIAVPAAGGPLDLAAVAPVVVPGTPSAYLPVAGGAVGPLVVTGNVSISGALDVAGDALGRWSARNHGVVAWVSDPAMLTSGQLATNGVVHLTGLRINRSTNLTKIHWGINTAGITPVGGQNHVGLYSAAGTRLAAVNVDASVTATGLISTTIPSTAVTPGLYWVAWVFNAATAPSPYRLSFLNASLVNLGLTVATARFATNGAGVTALPTPLVPATNVFAQHTYWAAVE